MTTIADITDFVRIIQEQPEWRDTIRGILLGQELLELPQRFAEFVRVTEENNRLVAERLARLEADVAELKSDVAGLKTSVAGLETAQSETNQRLDRLETAQSETNQRLDRLETAQSETNQRLDRLEGRVGNLEGAELERRVHGDIVNIASRRLGLNRARILQSRIVARTPELQDLIDDAEERNLITEEQGSHLEQTDIIIAARRRNDRQAVHVAVEISRAIADYDIRRARERADTLSAITDAPAIPAVVGGSIAPAQQELADELEVAAITVARLAW